MTRKLLLDLVTEPGIATYGDLLSALDAEGPQGRRQRLDRARVESGMDTIATEEAHRRFEVLQRGLRPGPDPAGRRLTGCAAEGCTALPTMPSGALRPVADRVWWCPAHKHLAGPEDHLPEPERYILNANFRPVPVGEEKKRLEAEDRRRREEWEREQEAKRREGERLQRIEDEYRATLKPPAWMRRG